MRLKIIVIDDEQCIRDSLQWFFEDLGHEVHTSPRPDSCDAYRGHSCSQSVPCGDVLLIDHNMPGMTGLEFIELLKHRGCKGITSNMLIMSGNAAGVDLRKAEALGCRVLQKPVSFDFLQDWLENIKARMASDASGKHVHEETAA